MVTIKVAIGSYALRLKWRKRASAIIAITGTLILLVVALSYYGQHVGSFVISMNSSGQKKGLSLSVNEDFSEPTTRLLADPLKQATDAEYADIPDEIDEGLGAKNAYRNETNNEMYFAYSFLLKNSAKEAVDYYEEFSIGVATRRLDSILRVMVIEDGNKDKETIYAKAREDEGHIGEPEEIIGQDGVTSLGKTVPFVNDEIIFKNKIEDFKPNQVKKYTIVMWLDGWDYQSSDELLRGALKLSLDFYLAA